MAEVKRASGEGEPNLANIKHFFGQVTLIFDHFLKIWYER
jgi:hypothetical protein